MRLRALLDCFKPDVSEQTEPQKHQEGALNGSGGDGKAAELTCPVSVQVYQCSSTANQAVAWGALSTAPHLDATSCKTPKANSSGSTALPPPTSSHTARTIFRIVTPSKLAFLQQYYKDCDPSVFIDLSSERGSQRTNPQASFSRFSQPERSGSGNTRPSGRLGLSHVGVGPTQLHLELVMSDMVLEGNAVDLMRTILDFCPPLRHAVQSHTASMLASATSKLGVHSLPTATLGSLSSCSNMVKGFRSFSVACCYLVDPFSGALEPSLVVTFMPHALALPVGGARSRKKLPPSVSANLPVPLPRHLSSSRLLQNFARSSTSPCISPIEVGMACMQSILDILPMMVTMVSADGTQLLYQNKESLQYWDGVARCQGGRGTAVTASIMLDVLLTNQREAVLAQVANGSQWKCVRGVPCNVSSCSMWEAAAEGQSERGTPLSQVNWAATTQEEGPSSCISSPTAVSRFLCSIDVSGVMRYMDASGTLHSIDGIGALRQADYPTPLRSTADSSQALRSVEPSYVGNFSNSSSAYRSIESSSALKSMDLSGLRLPNMHVGNSSSQLPVIRSSMQAAGTDFSDHPGQDAPLVTLGDTPSSWPTPLSHAAISRVLPLSAFTNSPKMCELPPSIVEGVEEGPEQHRLHMEATTRTLNTWPSLCTSTSGIYGMTPTTDFFHSVTREEPSCSGNVIGYTMPEEKGALPDGLQHHVSYGPFRVSEDELELPPSYHSDGLRNFTARLRRSFGAFNANSFSAAAAGLAVSPSSRVMSIIAARDRVTSQCPSRSAKSLGAASRSGPVMNRPGYKRRPSLQKLRLSVIEGDAGTVASFSTGLLLVDSASPTGNPTIPPKRVPRTVSAHESAGGGWGLHEGPGTAQSRQQLPPHGRSLSNYNVSLHPPKYPQGSQVQDLYPARTSRQLAAAEFGLVQTQRQCAHASSSDRLPVRVMARSAAHTVSASAVSPDFGVGSSTYNNLVGGTRHSMSELSPCPSYAPARIELSGSSRSTLSRACTSEQSQNCSRGPSIGNRFSNRTTSFSGHNPLWVQGATTSPSFEGGLDGQHSKARAGARASGSSASATATGPGTSLQGHMVASSATGTDVGAASLSSFSRAGGAAVGDAGAGADGGIGSASAASAGAATGGSGGGVGSGAAATAAMDRQVQDNPPHDPHSMELLLGELAAQADGCTRAHGGSAMRLLEDEEEDGPESQAGEGGVGEEEEAGVSWHEVIILPVLEPISGERAMLLLQSDISTRTELEMRMTALTEAQLDMLESMLPRHVLEYVVSAQDATSDLSSLARSHTNITVMFVDIVGFTAMSKEVPSQAVMGYLNEMFTWMDNLVDEHGVFKVDTAGDCYIVAGGLMKEDEDGLTCLDDGANSEEGARKVLKFAMDFMSKVSFIPYPNTGMPTAVRCGIHTGSCVSGLVGTKLPKFSLWGDTMNTASRMESTSKPGFIQVSEATLALLDETQRQQFTPTGGVEVKGKGMMQTYICDGTSPPESGWLPTVGSLTMSDPVSDQPVNSIRSSSPTGITISEEPSALRAASQEDTIDRIQVSILSLSGIAFSVLGGRATESHALPGSNTTGEAAHPSPDAGAPGPPGLIASSWGESSVGADTTGFTFTSPRVSPAEPPGAAHLFASRSCHSTPQSSPVPSSGHDPSPLYGLPKFEICSLTPGLPSKATNHSHTDPLHSAPTSPSLAAAIWGRQPVLSTKILRPWFQRSNTVHDPLGMPTAGTRSGTVKQEGVRLSAHKDTSPARAIDGADVIFASSGSIRTRRNLQRVVSADDCRKSHGAAGCMLSSGSGSTQHRVAEPPPSSSDEQQPGSCACSLPNNSALNTALSTEGSRTLLHSASSGLAISIGGSSSDRRARGPRKNHSSLSNIGALFKQLSDGLMAPNSAGPLHTEALEPTTSAVLVAAAAAAAAVPLSQPLPAQLSPGHPQGVAGAPTREWQSVLKWARQAHECRGSDRRGAVGNSPPSSGPRGTHMGTSPPISGQRGFLMGTSPPQ